jgi:NADH-quinone oxidoreductase subunit J
MELAVFLVSGAILLGAALGVVLFANPVHAALSLVATLFAVAVLFIAQEAHFLAAVQVIVYAGAIVVLFLFVIMLLGIDREDVLDEPLPAQRPLAMAVGVALFGGLVLLGRILEPTGATADRGSATQGEVANVERVARSLFTDFLWPFEITSALLVIAVVGAVVLARRIGPGVEPEAESEPTGSAGGSDEGPEAVLTPGGTPEAPAERPGVQGVPEESA